MRKQPLVSIVMPAYNAQHYIRQAVDSILQQSYSHFELIIIDDCSTDDTLPILHSYNDPRIILLTQDTNKGVGATSARGMEEAKGDYIARMDADDIMLPQRLEKQVVFMQANPQYGAIGTHYELFSDDTTKGRKVIIPITNDAIKFRLLFTFPFCHPTMMFRTSILREHDLNYDPAHPVAEDYALLCELADKTEFYNLPDSLLRYRKHAQSISTVKHHANAEGKWHHATKYHATTLSASLTQIPEYALLKTAYFMNEWEKIRQRPYDFAHLMRCIAEDYNQTTNTNERLTKGEAAELLWRALLFKAKMLKKPLALLRIALSKDGMVLALLHHIIRQLRLRLLRH